MYFLMLRFPSLCIREIVFISPLWLNLRKDSCLKIPTRGNTVFGESWIPVPLSILSWYSLLWTPSFLPWRLVLGQELVLTGRNLFLVIFRKALLAGVVWFEYESLKMWFTFWSFLVLLQVPLLMKAGVSSYLHGGNVDNIKGDFMVEEDFSVELTPT